MPIRTEHLVSDMKVVLREVREAATVTGARELQYSDDELKSFGILFENTPDGVRQNEMSEFFFGQLLLKQAEKI